MSLSLLALADILIASCTNIVVMEAGKEEEMWQCHMCQLGLMALVGQLIWYDTKLKILLPYHIHFYIRKEYRIDGRHYKGNLKK